MMQLRCGGNKLHGIMVTPGSGELEVRCESRWCGKETGIVVLHQFDLSTGEYSTKKFQEPTHRERGANGSRN